MYLSACFYSQGYAKYMQRKYALCWQMIRPPLGLVMCLEGTACSCPYRCGLLQRRSQSKVSRGKRKKGTRGQTQRELGPDFSSLLPVRAYKVCVTPPATCEMSAREAYQRLGAQSFYWGLVLQHSLPCTYQIPESQKQSRCSA